MIVFCDNCSNVIGETWVPIKKLYKNLFNANEGESAILCSDCYEEYKSEDEMTLVLELSYKN